MRTLLPLALLLAAASVHADESVYHSFEAAAPASGIRRVVVDVPAGDVTVRNGSSDRVAVSGRASREPDGPRSREKEQRIVDDISLEIAVSNGEAVIRRRFGPRARGWRAQTFSGYEFAVEVPPGLHVDVKTRAGTVSMDGSFGDIDVDLRAGEVDLQIPRAEVRELRASCRIGEVHTRIGNEVTHNEGVFPGRTRYVNPSGRTFVNVHVTAGEVRVTLKD